MGKRKDQSEAAGADSATATVEKPKRSRRGRMRESAGGAEAFVAGAGAAAPLDFDAGEIGERLRLFWKSGHGDQFVRQGADGRWSIWPKLAIMDEMRMLPDRLIAMKAREGERLSEAQRVLLWVRQERCLDEIFPALPGYGSGIYQMETGERVLVRTEARRVVPEAGEWPTIGALVKGLLDRSEVAGDVDQSVFFYAWCKVALESLMRGKPGSWRAGHAMILAGPAGCGKSRLQENVITPLLGGRFADPQKFLFGTDEFNADVFAAEHLSMGEVPLPSQKTVDRTALAERIKQVVANAAQRMRLMRTEPWTVFPYWRLTISVNDDPDKLRSLPLITSDFADKVLIFHCAHRPLPLPTRSPEEQEVFRETLKGELPAFAHWLLNDFVIPKELEVYGDGRDATRFGFREWHHPIIKGGLFDDTPGAELMGLIDMATFEGDDGMKGLKLWDLPSWSKVEGVWHERAEHLQMLLTGDGGYRSSVVVLAKRLFAHSRCSMLLSRLAAEPSLELRIQKADTRHAKGWKIARPSVAGAGPGVV